MLILFIACSIIPFRSQLTAKQHLAKGLALYDKQEYKGAQKHLKQVVDKMHDAQYLPKALYLYGESLYHLKDFSTASQQFSRLSLSFPTDSLAGIARQKIQMCYQKQFHQAMKKYKDEDYLDARDELKIIILSSRMSSIIDSARYYYADCYFHTKEYILAIGEFQRLMKFYPRSSLVDDAQYKIGMCYYKLSPQYALDQEYTYKAIQEFQAFLEEYPKSELQPEVEKMFLVCRNKLSKKEYKVGELYRKMGELEPAIISYQKVIDTYYDTEFAAFALYWKARCLRKLEKYDAAKQNFDEFLLKYPDHKLFGSAQALSKKLTQELEKEK